jgi:hypothetical protein
MFDMYALTAVHLQPRKLTWDEVAAPFARPGIVERLLHRLPRQRQAPPRHRV